MTKRILVVEDQEDNRQIIRDMLSATDYQITEAENGEEALAAVAKQRPDLILMDIQMPIMDGYEATRRIKADAGLRSVPIIAITSYALSGDEQKARAAGCDDYVPKPYSPRQLLAKIRQYLPWRDVASLGHTVRLMPPSRHLRDLVTIRGIADVVRHGRGMHRLRMTLAV